MKNLKNFWDRTLCLLFFSAICGGLNAQMITFQQVYQSTVDQSGREALETDDGYILIGMTGNPNYWDSSVYIMKTNKLGETQWTKTYGGSQTDYPYQIIESGDGNYLIAGITKSFGAGNYDIWLLKINPSGDTLWTKTYGTSGDDQAKDIISTSDGNFMITGRSKGTGTLGYDAYLMKIDPAGTVLWKKYYGGAQYEIFRSVKQCMDGGYIAAGATMSYGQGNADIWLVRTNVSGDTLWTKTYGGANIDDGNGVVINNDGSYTVVAETNTYGAGDMDVQIMKVNSTGAVIWNKYYGGTDKDVSKTIYPTTDGGYIVGGISRSFGWIEPEMWLLKFDSGGDTLWTRNYGSWDHEHCHAAKQVSDGGYIAIGHTRSYGPNKKMMFIKLDALGTPSSVFENEKEEDLASIFPNPSNGNINIGIRNFLPGEKHFVLRITNAMGQEIYAETISPGSAPKQIDLNAREPGIYFLTLQSSARITTRRLILE